MIHVEIRAFQSDIGTYLQIAKTGKFVRLMDNGVEIARLIPPEFDQACALNELERLRKTAVVGDILAPIDIEWHAG